MYLPKLYVCGSIFCCGRTDTVKRNCKTEYKPRWKRECGGLHSGFAGRGNAVCARDALTHLSSPKEICRPGVVSLRLHPALLPSPSREGLDEDGNMEGGPYAAEEEEPRLPCKYGRQIASARRAGNCRRRSKRMAALSP